MQTDTNAEARRQVEICNACRYCEGFCSVFPSLQSLRSFSDGDIMQLANLCHNCRNCYHACQYTAPHEFNLNIPKALAEVRRESWEEFAWPKSVSRLVQTRGALTVLATVIGMTFMFAVAQWMGAKGGAGFYAVMSHVMMVAIFLPAFLLPLVSILFGLRLYWRAVGGKPITWGQIKTASGVAARLKNLKGGHGDGCNFEDEDRFSHSRRRAHHLILLGFLLCFASTSVATIMHYALAWPAPYAIWTPPKLLGIPGGILLTTGCAWMVTLKLRAERNLGDSAAWSADMAFIGLLGFVGLSGLLLYWAGSTSLMPVLLAVHLGAVLAFFLLTPYSKMAHGFYRLAALMKDVQRSAGHI